MIMGFTGAARCVSYFGRANRIEKNMEDVPDWVYQRVIAPVFGPRYDVNISFACVSPYATPFIYIQHDSSADWFCIVDRAWKLVLFFNTDRFTETYIKEFFPSHRRVSLVEQGIQGQNIALEFAVQLCLTGIKTLLPLDEIMRNNVDFEPLAEPEDNLRHVTQQYGFNFVDTPLIHLPSLCGHFFGQSFNITNHIAFFLKLLDDFGSLSEKALRDKMTCTPELLQAIERFQAFAKLVKELCFLEPLLFSVVVPRDLHLDRRSGGSRILAQLTTTELMNLARLIFLRNSALLPE
jgi:hypothetical protein